MPVIVGSSVRISKTLSFHGPSVCRSFALSGEKYGRFEGNLLHGRIARVLFCAERECMVLLHGFIKKTQKTPKQDIDLAIKRKKGEGA